MTTDATKVMEPMEAAARIRAAQAGCPNDEQFGECYRGECDGPCDCAQQAKEIVRARDKALAANIPPHVVEAAAKTLCGLRRGDWGALPDNVQDAFKEEAATALRAALLALEEKENTDA